MGTTLIDGMSDARKRGASFPGDSENAGSLLYGASSFTSRLRAQLRGLAPFFRTALITGETGAGKCRVASELHRLSHSNGPFVLYEPADARTQSSASPPACKAPSRQEMWGELFQTTRGGTLVVNEIGELSPADQACLLQQLRSPGWRQAGADRAQVIGASRYESRVLASTGRLRHDLHAILSAVELRVPPLRSRPDDVEELALAFLAEAAAEFRVEEPRLAADAIAQLQSRSWPGNVGELRSVMRELVHSGVGPWITAGVLDPRPAAESEEVPARASLRLQDAVDTHVCRVLSMCGGNKVKTAELLGVSRSTLYRMLETLPSAVP